MQLNERQQRAVDQIACPVLVLAGAGSGKTSVITEKIIHLIKNCHYAPDNIAAVTFTNKAAKEMQQRLRSLLGPDLGDKIRTSTFHTLGMAILRKDIGRVNRSHHFSIFDEQDSLQVLNDLTERQIKGDKGLLYELKNRISFCKSEGIKPKQLRSSASNQQQQFDAHIYQAYQDHMELCNALDFDDLISLPVELLNEHQDIRSHWQNQIRYLLVDEYQDTNQAQYQMVKLLAGPDPKITVVGDDDQSIYAWRGAKPENLQQLQEDFPTLEVVKLEQNYRCCQRVLKVANHLIANNPHIFEKQLWSQHQQGEQIRIIENDDEEHEADFVVADLVSQRISGRLKYSDFAILYRGNHQAKLFEKALIKHGIPYQISGGMSFFARAEIRDLMAYFRLIANPDDDAACIRVINVPRRSIGAKTLQVLAQAGRDNKQSLFKSCKNSHNIANLGARAQTAINDFTQLIEQARASTQFDVDKFLIELGYDHWLMETSSSPKVAEGRWNNVQELCRWIKDGLAQSDSPDLAEVVNQLLIRDLQQQEEDSDSVQLLTLHAAKGLEYSQVYMVGMEEDLLPHRSSIEEDNIEEERRLCYVGITRAKHGLVMTLAKKRRRFGEVSATEPSRFLEELPQEEIDWPDQAGPISEEEQQDKNQFYRDQLAALLKG